MFKQSLQKHFAPNSICFGCGPANLKGLHIESFVEGDKLIAHWQAEKHHEAFPGVLNGGIVGALLDCHCNWTAAWHLMNRDHLDHMPCTVTAEYAIKLLRPTPTNTVLNLEAKVISAADDKATIAGQIIANEKICATCIGTFVAVKSGHPAYHRW